MNKLESLLDLLSETDEVQKINKFSWQARCPAHTDRNKSLTISAGNGRVLIWCHAGCSWRKIIKILDLKPADLFDDDITPDPMIPLVFGARKDTLSSDEEDNRHLAYNLLIKGLSLLDRHRTDLRKRGLTDEVIDRNEYRSISPVAALKAVRLVVEKLGEGVIGTVPGFMKDALARPTVSCRCGILIPMRELSGKIIAAQVRTPDPNRKYQWLSWHNCSVKSVAHCPIGSPPPGSVVRVTEGPLKADIATALDPAHYCIGVGGVKSAADALFPLEALKPSEVRSCFDADVWLPGKEHAGKSIRRFNDTLFEKDYNVRCEWWDLAEGKGIDDLLLSGGKPNLTGVELERGQAQTEG